MSASTRTPSTFNNSADNGNEPRERSVKMVVASIFTDAPGHVVRDLLGLDEGDVFVCTSYPGPL